MRFVAAGIAGILLMGCERSSPSAGREEIRSVPGAVAVHEGQSDHAEMFDEAKSLIEKRDFAGAERVYKTILARDPGSADACIGIGTSRLLQNDLARAALHYRQALELDPRSTSATIGLGSVAYKQARYEDAESFYRKALAADRNNADAHWGMGLTAEAVGKTEDAKQHFATFLELAPDSGLAELARAKLTALR